MKRLAVLAAALAFAFALAGPTGAKSAESAPPQSPAVAGAPLADAAAQSTAPAAPLGAAPAATRNAAAQSAAAQTSAEREVYALMAAALLAIGVLFWRRRGNDDEA